VVVEPAEASAAVAAADTTETPPAVEPKKPARKKVAHKQQPQNFWDFFSGRGFDNRSYDNRSYNNRSARANDRSNGFRPFF
jgi:hypothetical protein